MRPFNSRAGTKTVLLELLIHAFRQAGMLLSAGQDIMQAISSCIRQGIGWKV